MMLFGWCLTEYHDQCKHTYMDWNNTERTCDCACHTEGDRT